MIALGTPARLNPAVPDPNDHVLYHLAAAAKTVTARHPNCGAVGDLNQALRALPAQFLAALPQDVQPHPEADDTDAQVERRALQRRILQLEKELEEAKSAGRPERIDVLITESAGEQTVSLYLDGTEAEQLGVSVMEHCIDDTDADDHGVYQQLIDFESGVPMTVRTAIEEIALEWHKTGSEHHEDGPCDGECPYGDDEGEGEAA